MIVTLHKASPTNRMRRLFAMAYFCIKCSLVGHNNEKITSTARIKFCELYTHSCVRGY